MCLACFLQKDGSASYSSGSSSLAEGGFTPSSICLRYRLALTSLPGRALRALFSAVWEQPKARLMSCVVSGVRTRLAAGEGVALLTRDGL